MPTAVQIPPNLVGYDFRHYPAGVTGFEYNGNQYIIASEGQTFQAGGEDGKKFHVLKSTDLGATWSDIGSATFAVGGATTDPVTAFTVCVKGSTAYILAVDTGGTNSFSDFQTSPIEGFTLNLTNDTITSSGSLSGAPIVYKFWRGVIGLSPNRCVALHLVNRPSNGDMLLYYNGAPEVLSSSKYTRVYQVSLSTGLSFGSPSIVPGQTGNTVSYGMSSFGTDASGNFHLLLFDSVSPTYFHIAATSDGVTYGSLQTVETNAYYDNIGPSGNISNLINFDSNGTDTIAFLGVRNRSSAVGDITVYYANGTLTPTWHTQGISSSKPAVINPTISSAVTTRMEILNGQIAAMWTCSGSSPSWSHGDGLGVIEIAVASPSSLTSWSGNSDLFGSDPDYSTVQISTWLAPSIGFAVLGNFANEFTGNQQSWFWASGPTWPGTGTPITRSVSDTISLSDASVYTLCVSLPVTQPGITLTDGISISIGNISGGGGGGGTPPPDTGGGGGTITPPPDSKGVRPPSTCIFEYYNMEKPEDVEILPVPKKYDQLGPMRFDKIGKVFGFRLRLIPNGSLTSIPYAIYGDNSLSLPTLNSLLFRGSFSVVPGIDKVYEIQLPKSINTCVCRLTLGPTSDSFHRYDVYMKVHTSGMEGQAKWLLIR